MGLPLLAMKCIYTVCFSDPEIIFGYFETGRLSLFLVLICPTAISLMLSIIMTFADTVEKYNSNALKPLLDIEQWLLS